MERGGITYQNPGHFLGMTFHTKKNSKAQSLVPDIINNWSLHLKSTMRLPVIATMKDAKEKKRSNMNIGVGSIVKAKVRYMSYN